MIADHGFRTADRAGLGAGHGAHYPALADQGAGKRDDDCHAACVNLRMTGIVNPGDVSGVLDEHVLESASCAKERNVSFTGMPNRGEGALGAAVRAPRRDPDAVDACETGSRVGELIGWDPCRRDAVRQAAGGTVQSSVRGKRGVVVADEGKTTQHHSARIAEETCLQLGGYSRGVG